MSKEASFSTELLSLLEENPLRSSEILAKLLGREPSEVEQEVARLENEKVILAYKAIIDDEKAQRRTVKAVIEVKLVPERGGGFDRLAQRIARYSEVTSCFLMSGGYDLLVFLEGSTLQEVALFVSEKLATLRGVTSTATHFMLRTYKEQGILVGEAVATNRLPVSP
ncbi:Lrp/AsnC family transcriptional regulator [Verrucomicrobium sp. 3C]|uniref:Lrp/AsnC family transcriptional regulator n=1 Tax=Verrucomicrobium sp. 3C TaxID=1134055 RepID=UPI000363A115|nr:Lrp/AsnC family transcriptional regulator [Verrucomicrobium sp. 3C]